MDHSTASDLQFPRHMAALNELAARSGYSVLLRIADIDGEASFIAEWAGPKAKLEQLGLFKPGQLRRLPFTSGVLYAGGYDGEWFLPLVVGTIANRGNEILYEVDFGAVPISITMKGDVETASYKEFVTHHGTAEALVAAGICDRKALPTGLRAFRSGNRWSETSKRWAARRQPDGTYLFRIESDNSFRSRSTRCQELREDIAAHIARQDGLPPPKPASRPSFIRLVIDNTLR